MISEPSQCMAVSAAHIQHGFNAELRDQFFPNVGDNQDWIWILAAAKS